LFHYIFIVVSVFLCFSNKEIITGRTEKRLQRIYTHRAYKGNIKFSNKKTFYTAHSNTQQQRCQMVAYKFQ